MTRKDYIAIAEALHANYNAYPRGTERAAIEEAAKSIATAMVRDNPRFNREHFLAVVRGEKAMESRPARTRRNAA